MVTHGNASKHGLFGKYSSSNPPHGKSEDGRFFARCPPEVFYSCLAGLALMQDRPRALVLRPFRSRGDLLRTFMPRNTLYVFGQSAPVAQLDRASDYRAIPCPTQKRDCCVICCGSNFVLSGSEGRQQLEPPAENGGKIYAHASKFVQTTNELKFHHSVYVVLLDDAVAKHSSILRANPRRDPSKPCVYVGMTGLPVDHRFENHKNGYKSAWVVKKYGVRLMPELYEHLNPMPFEAATKWRSNWLKI
jgi:hypothetical protein